MDKYFKLIESKHLKKDISKFHVGDTVVVQVKIVEEGSSRLQAFEGIVIAKSGAGIQEAFTVRKVSYGEGVEIVFPLHSPSIEKITVVRKGDVKRAKLYYLKKMLGKETKVDEKIEHAESAQETTPPREEAG